MLIDDHKVNESIGTQLRRIREKKGMSQWLAAEKAGVSETTYGTIERAKFNIKLVDLIRISEVLKADLHEIIRIAIEEAERRNEEDSYDGR